MFIVILKLCIYDKDRLNKIFSIKIDMNQGLLGVYNTLLKNKLSLSLIHVPNSQIDWWDLNRWPFCQLFKS